MSKFFEPELLLSDYNKKNLTKWREVYHKNCLPFWVADMDFQVCRPIKNAIIQQANDGHFGYASLPEELERVVIERLKKLYDWQVSPEQIIWKSGLVTFLHSVSRIFGGPKGKVIVPVPIYYHLFNAPDWGGQEGIRIPLINNGKGLNLDLVSIEKAMQKGVKVFNLCNPQNPGGGVFKSDSLEKLAYLCEKYDVLLCSDEIHCDLILDKNLKHIPIASLNEKIAQRTFTLMSPSKTFNTAGLSLSFCIVKNPTLREKLIKGMRGIVPNPPITAYKAALAAYTKGDEWLKGLLDYLSENKKILYRFFDKQTKLEIQKPHEATYLAWIKIKDIKAESLEKVFLKNGIMVSPGRAFESDNYFRFNFGCHKKTLLKGLDAIEKSLAEIS